MATVWSEKLTSALVAKELSFLGMGEEPPGSNRGKVPDACYKCIYGADADPGAVSVAEDEWCAGFVCTCLISIGVKGGPRTYSTGGIWEWGKEHNSCLLTPRMGDLGLRICSTSPTGFDHTVTVEHNFGTGQIHYIAGNEGDKVARGILPIDSFKFVRPYTKENLPK